MKIPARLLPPVITLLALLPAARFAGAETFRVATYNVENYLDAATETRYVKSAEAKAKIRESIRALSPDVLALQEMGSISALIELRDSLKAEGLDLPYWEHVAGFDTNVHVAVLSKFPFSARRSHTNDNFLLSGRRFHVSRGFAEVDIAVNPNYSFTLIAAHLKSKRPIAQADEAELRLEEAKLLREKVDARFAANPNANLVVLGDFNDHKDAAPTRAVIGRGKYKLTDTRPAERNGDDAPSTNPAWDPRNITWTHYYGREDAYSRIDFLLLSPGMAREWVPGGTCVLALANWGVGSDHRPIVATFEAADK
ncbi:MAG TPA: endonuclease/exonuclease/phosphatase family protein [Candidatus Paceibacterota bacterium]|nr:endonuclease/exonuclease/phosphatase family protein [Verrucomicrobiota bacterium]HSA11603.1 endonuclease/exonuclease/phosphatase family protein [Candidatus Paceibacterota bacterium]